MNSLRTLIIVILLLVVSNVRAGGIFGDIVNLVAPGVGTELDQMHEDFQNQFDAYNQIVQNLTNFIPNPITIACTVPFDAIKNTVMTSCAPSDEIYNAIHQESIQEAIDLLVANNMIESSEFHGVQIRWCPFVNGAGVTPESNRIYLNSSFINESLIERAVLIAHEMTHIRQFRNFGSDEFKCKYSKEFIGCGGCQDESNTYEKSAFDFGETVRNKLSKNSNITNQFPPSSTAYLNYSTLFFSGKPTIVNETYGSEFNYQPVPEHLQEFKPSLVNVDNVLVNLSYYRNQIDKDPDTARSYYNSAALDIYIPQIGFDLLKIGDNFQLSTYLGSDYYGLTAYARDVGFFKSNTALPRPFSFILDATSDRYPINSDLLPDSPIEWKSASINISFQASDRTYRWVNMQLRPIPSPFPHINISDRMIDFSLNIDSTSTLLNQNADWWIVKRSPSGRWFYYSSSGRWEFFGLDSEQAFDTVTPFYQGPLINTRNLQLFDIYGASSGEFGEFILYFGVDYNKNGKLDFNKLFYTKYQYTLTGMSF